SSLDWIAAAPRSNRDAAFKPAPFGREVEVYRFENWNDRRALARPYFLRSTTRGSRVRNPPRLSTARRSGSKLVSALEMPWRTAPAWPDSPPPDTVHTTSYWPLRLAAASGCWISIRNTGRAK